MTPEKILKLIDDLREATDEGKIRWRETAEEDVFRAVLRSGMIRLGREETYDEETSIWKRGFLLTILNSDARVVEEFERWGGDGYSELAGLYERARRSARQGDSLIDAMLAEVEGRDRSGESR